MLKGFVVLFQHGFDLLNGLHIHSPFVSGGLSMLKGLVVLFQHGFELLKGLHKDGSFLLGGLASQCLKVS